MSFEAIFSGLFGGAGVLLLWEVVLKPMRQGRALAEVISAEVSINLELLTAAQSLSKKLTGVPADLRVSTTVFESVTAQIGDLPPNLVGEVVFLYRYFIDLNAQPQAWVDGVKELRGYQPGSPNYQATERELRRLVAIFRQCLSKAIARTELVQPLLLKAASPWWSIRGRRRSRPVSLNVEDLELRMEKAMRERDLLLDESNPDASARR